MNQQRTKTVIFWVATSLLAFGMLLGGFGQLTQAKFNADGMVHLGYPLYVMPLVGAWKIGGVLLLLLPRRALAKEWAYAGFFFVLSGATVSHLASGDGLAGALAPLVFTGLTVASWALRPADRRLSGVSLFGK